MNKKMHRDVTQRFIDALRSGVIPWRKHYPNCGLATNIATKKSYGGINSLLLGIASLTFGFQNRWWGSSQQWLKLGGQIKYKECGTKIVCKKDSADLFNLDQVEGDVLNQWRTTDDCVLDPNYQSAQVMIRATKANFCVGRNRCLYVRPTPEGSWPNHVAGDYIQLPPSRQFFSQSDYYEAAFHELAHWTEVRRAWKGSYAEGELIAEIAACSLSQILNIPQSTRLDNHATYLASWLATLDSDHDFIFRVSKEASKAVECVLGRNIDKKPLLHRL